MVVNKLQQILFMTVEDTVHNHLNETYSFKKRCRILNPTDRLTIP